MSQLPHFPTAFRKIGDKTYTVRALAAKPGRATLVRLIRVLGPTMAAAFASAPEGAKDAPASGVVDALKEFCARLTEDDLEYFYAVFAECTEVQGPSNPGPVPLTDRSLDAFAADYGSMLEWLAFCVDHNYSSFLGDLKATARRG